MGIGIAYVFALAGYPVAVADASADLADRAVARIREVADRAVAKGRLSPELAAGLTARVRPVPSAGQLPAGLSVVVEAVPERVELKRTVLAELAAREPALLATNTSGISIGELGRDLPDPARFLGLHFFNPVWAMPLVENVYAPSTGAAARTAARELVAELGKEAIEVADAPGFATSRLGLTLGLEAMRMLADGVASAADIDKAMELGYRHPMGPLRLTDLVGLDVRLDIARVLEAAYGPRFTPPRILIDLVEQGHLGKKTGRGFYDWSEPAEGHH
jgi:3-hydroxybutyryl-CoA dehydrogenase